MMPLDKPERLILGFDLWPLTDRVAWDAACRQGDPFDEAGFMANSRPKTRTLLAGSYGRWLGWLTTGGLLHDDDLPVDRVRQDWVQQYAADLELECRDTTVHIRIFGLARAINAMAPDGDWNWLFRMAAHLRLNIHDKKDKQPRIRSSRELHELGMSLMADADEYSKVPWKCATRFRDGLIIALLAARPLRIRNLAGLVIGSHITETSEGFTLRIPADEVKTHINLEFPLPLDLVQPMRRYLAIHRPVLLGGNEDGHLWITKHGDWMRDGAIYNRVTKLTKKAFGVSVNPHLFRDCAATSMAIEDPEHVHAASKLLGHATIETTTRHYNQATSLSAGRAICNNIQAMRQRRLKDLKPGLEG